MSTSKYWLRIFPYERLDDFCVVLLLLSGVFDFLPKSARKSITFVVFCFHILNWYTIDFIDSLIVNVLFLLAIFMQLSRRLIVFINRSFNPIALWSFPGAVIMLLVFCWQKISNLFPFNQCAWSSIIFRGTTSNCKYSSSKLTTLGPLALSKTSFVGYLEKRLIHARKCVSRSFSLVNLA